MLQAGLRTMVSRLPRELTPPPIAIMHHEPCSIQFFHVDCGSMEATPDLRAERPCIGNIRIRGHIAACFGGLRLLNAAAALFTDSSAGARYLPVEKSPGQGDWAGGKRATTVPTVRV